MNIEEIVKKVDKVEGCFVEIGFGKGKTADTILNLMKDGKVKKRTSYLVDSFKSVPIGPAMDRRHVLPGYDIKVVKALIKDSIPKDLKGINIAVLQVDLGSKEANKKAITALSSLMSKNGIVIPIQKEEEPALTKVEEVVEVKEVAFGVRLTESKAIYLESVGRFADVKAVKNNTKKERTAVPEVRYKRK